MLRYSCLRAMLPSVEAALAAEGYTVERPLSRAVGDERVLVMTQAAAVVLLTESERSEVADIEVYGSAQSAAAMLLEQLPLQLTRQPSARAVGERQI